MFWAKLSGKCPVTLCCHAQLVSALVFVQCLDEDLIVGMIAKPVENFNVVEFLGPLVPNLINHTLCQPFVTYIGETFRILSCRSLCFVLLLQLSFHGTNANNKLYFQRIKNSNEDSILGTIFSCCCTENPSGGDRIIGRQECFL